MSIWRAIVMILTLRCEESTRLMSAEFERQLTGVERWAVRLHAISCNYCRRVRSQFKLIQQAAAHRSRVMHELPREARERLIASIRNQRGNES